MFMLYAGKFACFTDKGINKEEISATDIYDIIWQHLKDQTLHTGGDQYSR